MAEVLETLMLVCFGLSWPINVWKNLKARTAKNMSLRFIMLIIIGYVAGIIAKIYKGAINYVFVVYIINLLIVSVNVVIYFVNKKIDKKSELKTSCESDYKQGVFENTEETKEKIMVLQSDSKSVPQEAV